MNKSKFKEKEVLKIIVILLTPEIRMHSHPRKGATCFKLIEEK